ncbi:ribonuclease H-like domain-containing protein [Tanacetum coccineum]
MDKCKTGLGYNAVLPSYTGNFMPPKSNLVYPSVDDFVDVNEYVFESEEEDVPKITNVEMFNKPNFAKINFVKSNKQVKYPRKTSVDKNRQNTPSPRGNKRNWNQKMSQKLGNNFEMFNKACHVCGSFEHLRKDCNDWYNNQRSGPISLNAARPVNTVQPRTAVNNAGPIKMQSAVVNTARPKAVISAVMGNKGNVVKASACWVWRPKHKVLDHVSRNNGASMSFKRFEYVDAQGKSKAIHNYEEIDGGLVTFGGNSKLGKKNNVLFTDTACVVLSPDFKLTDEGHVLLKVPRKDNMYSVDLKNVVPQGGIENLIDLKVKVIRCGNGTEFKNRVMNQFCEMKGIKREFSIARTPQQKGVAERKNRTLIEAARTMLADSKLATTF